MEMSDTGSNNSDKQNQKRSLKNLKDASKSFSSSSETQAPIEVNEQRKASFSKQLDTKIIDNEKAFVSALYNTLAITILAICIGLCYLLFSVLQVFIRAILWSILTSALLFPFKRFLTDFARVRLESIQTTESTLALELFLTPFRLIDSTINLIWSFIRTKFVQFLVMVIFICFLNLIASFHESVFNYSTLVYSFLSTNFFSFLELVDNSWIISSSIALVYMITISIYWQDNYTLLFQILSLPVWSIVFLLASKLLGSYRPIFMLVFLVLTSIGVFSSIKEYTSNLNDSYFLNLFNNLKNSKKKKPPAVKQSKQNRKKESDIYFKALFWLFICVKFRYDLYIAVPFIIFVWKISKKILFFLYEAITSNEAILYYFGLFREWIVARKEVLAPKPFLVLIRFFVKGDQKINQQLQKSMDSIVTTFIMFGLMAVLITSFVLLAMQVQSESIQLITITSNALNENVYSRPWLNKWLPEKQNLKNFYSTTMKNIYVFGKDWLLKTLRSSLYTESVAQSNNKTDYIILETRLLEHWDSVYSYLSQNVSSFSKNLTSNTIEGNKNSTLKKYWSSWKSKLNENDPFNYNYIMVILKDNFGMLMSVLDSLYQFLRGNMNILITILYTVVSTIFVSGFALVNFFFSFLVYLSVLFYLLSMSADSFKPFTWLTENNLIKFLNTGSAKLSLAIEDSIRSVFLASLKMALFYGLYTYLINCLFAVSIVYLPAIIASLFAFLPLFGTYWVSIPGVLELWLIQDSPIFALVFVIMHLLPYLVSVDQAIYSEIDAGHPYLTGLAFVGGVYLAGLEGALIGPIVLCLIIVIGKLLASFQFTSYSRNFKIMRAMSIEI